MKSEHILVEDAKEEGLELKNLKDLQRMGRVPAFMYVRTSHSYTRNVLYLPAWWKFLST